MKAATITLTSLAPYSQSRSHEEPKLEKELHDAYEQRTWRSKCHVNTAGSVIIPANAIGNCIREAAKYLSLQIPGKGKATYTKHFWSGIGVIDDIVLPVKAAQLPCDRLYLNSDGRVWRYFPRVDNWTGTTTVFIYDDILTEEVVTTVIQQAGHLVGLGRFRPTNRGFYGRFRLDKLEWFEESDAIGLAGGAA
jgi:hypothetical protein